MPHTSHQGLTKVSELRYIIMVKDLSSQRGFYEKIFDWPIIKDWGGSILYNTGAATLELIHDTQAKTPNGSSRIAIAVPDVHSLFNKIKDKVELIFPIRDNSWGDTSFRFKDPEGFPITIFTPHDKSSNS